MKITNIKNKLPLELNDELLHFVPEFFCRRVLVRSNFSFFCLVQRSKRAKHWKHKDINAQEEQTTYGFGDTIYRPLVPRLETHRVLTSFVGNLCAPNHFFRPDHNSGRFCVVSINTHEANNFEMFFVVNFMLAFPEFSIPSAEMREMVRTFFHDNEAGFTKKYYFCELQFFPMNELPWDVAVLKLYAETMGHIWDPLFTYLDEVITSLENGDMPPYISESSPNNSANSLENLPSVEAPQSDD